MCKIGIMGGTFNPIHKGHIQIAQSAYEQYHLDEVWFMPNHIPAYKDNTEIVSGIDRYRMVEMAIETYAYFKASDFELKQDGATYTCNTLALLKKRYPQHEFYFIMGADSLYHIESWKDPEKILEMATIVVAGRAGTGTSLSSQIEYIENKYDATIYRLNSPVLEISSNDIRRRVRDGESIRYLLPSKVVDYIYGHNLYQPDPPEEVQKENEQI